MAFLPEVIQWEDGTYQLEETDLVIGGVNGISNEQGKQLGNRTAYLKDRLGRFDAIVEVTLSADVTVAAVDLVDKHVQLVGITTGKILTLTASTLKDGSIVSIAANQQGAANRCAAIVIDSGMNFTMQTGAVSTVFLYPGESYKFVKEGTRLHLHESTARLDEVGEILYKAKQPFLAIEAKGQIVNRVDYPRLWTFAESIAINDSAWISGNANTGSFSKGNGFLTFRLPDLRGVFLRGLDKGRGFDLDRITAGEGLYQADGLVQHKHKIDLFEIGINAGNGAGMKVLAAQAPSNPFTTTPKEVWTQNTGVTETRGKNVAFTAYLKY